MKNYRTPRTQADAEFDLGYPQVPRRSVQFAVDAIYAVITVAGCVAIGLILAWGF